MHSPVSINCQQIEHTFGIGKPCSRHGSGSHNPSLWKIGIPFESINFKLFVVDLILQWICWYIICLL